MIRDQDEISKVDVPYRCDNTGFTCFCLTMPCLFSLTIEGLGTVESDSAPYYMAGRRLHAVYENAGGCTAHMVHIGECDTNNVRGCGNRTAQRDISGW